MRKISSKVAFVSCATAAYAQTGASIQVARGSASVTVGSAAVRAIYEMTQAGLRASISILDRENPRVVLFRETIMLQEDQQRIVELPRRKDGTTVRVVITRRGKAIHLTAGGEREN